MPPSASTAVQVHGGRSLYGGTTPLLLRGVLVVWGRYRPDLRAGFGDYQEKLSSYIRTHPVFFSRQALLLAARKDECSSCLGCS